MSLTNSNPVAGNLPASTVGPHEPVAEQAILGAILFDNAVLPEVMKLLKPDDFFMLRHGWIYDVFLTLHSRGESVDELSVTRELQAIYAERFNDLIGGSGYITELSNNCPTVNHWWTYARMVQSTARQRKLLTKTGDLAAAVLSGNKDRVNSIFADLADIQSEINDRQGLRQYLMHASELQNLPPLSWLIDKEIPDRGLTMLFGAPGSGKSFLALDYALKLAQTMPILYVAGEGIYGYQQRVAAWKAHNHLLEGQLHMFNNPVALIDPSVAAEFSEIVKEIKPKLIVVDTLAGSMLPADENSTRDVGMYLRECSKQMKEHDCAILLVHHTGKTGSSERGSSALRGSCDSMIKVNVIDDVITIECDKSKDAEMFPTRYMKLVPVPLDDGKSSAVLIPTSKIISSPDDKLSRQQTKILQTLEDTFAHGATAIQLEESTSVPRSSIYTVLGKLTKLGYISQAFASEPYEITPAGKRKLEGVSTESNESHF